MADPLSALSLASAIVQFVDFGCKIVGRLNEYRKCGNDIPKAFQNISTDLPLLIDNLNRTKAQIEAREISEETAKALKPVVERCWAQTKQLDELLERILPTEQDSTWRRRKKALASLSRGNAIQQIMSDIDSHLQQLLLSIALKSPTPCGHTVLYSTLQLPAPITETRIQNSPQPCFTVKFAREENFVGREDIIKEIDRRFSETQRCVAMAGVGGVGKSQIAIEYCYRYRQMHPEANIFWVHASNHVRFSKAYHEIGRELALSDVDNPNVDTLQLVKQWLSNDANGPWLLVLDNADDIETLFGSTSNESTIQDGQQTTALFNYLPRSLNGLMIVTTRDRRIAGRLARVEKPIEILPFEMQDAQRLLRKTLQEVNLNNDHSTELLQALDFLPMAITQAAAYIRENSVGLVGYLDHFRASDTEAKDLLNTTYHDPGRDPESHNSVFQTLKISFDRIRRQKPRAAEILSLMAVLDRCAIPEKLLHKDDEGNIEFDTAIGTLKAFSLITEEKVQGTFAMHRLVQLSMQRWLELEDALVVWKKEAIDAVCKECTAHFPFAEDWKMWETMNPHVQVVLGYSFDDESLMKRAIMLHRTSLYEAEKGHLADSQAYAFEAYATVPELDRDHPWNLIIATWVSGTLYQQQKFEESEEMNRQLLEKKERLLGFNHPYTVFTRSHWANTIAHLGKHDEAELLLHEIVRACASSPNPIINICGLDAMQSIALNLKLQGKYEEAEVTLIKVIDGYSKHYSAKHPLALYHLCLLASVLMEQDKLAAAETIARQALEYYESTHGLQHGNTLAWCFPTLADILEKQEKLEEAVEVRRQTFHGSERLFGSKHEITLSASLALVHALERQNKVEEAEVICRQTLRTCEDVFGPGHRRSLSAMALLARVLEFQEKYDESKTLSLRLLHGNQITCGPRHPNTIYALNHVVVAMLAQEKFEDVEKLCCPLLDDYQTEPGLDCKAVLYLLIVVAQALTELRKYERALQLSKLVAAESYEKLSGIENSTTLNSLIALACILEKHNNYEAAEAIRQRVLKMQEKAHGPDHLDTCWAMYDLASNLQMRKSYHQAAVLYRRAGFRSREKLGLSPRHPLPAGCTMSLITIWLVTPFVWAPKYSYKCRNMLKSLVI